MRLAYNDGGGFQLVGADNTNDRGHWQLFYNGGNHLPHGHYFAVISGGRNHGVKCERDQSKIIAVS